MKKRIQRVMLILIIFGATISAFGVEKATKQECVSKTNKAARSIEEIGLEPTLKYINDKKGPFVWKDSYVFVIENRSAKMLAHPYIPTAMMGKSFKELVDKKGKPYFKEFLKVANNTGKGWVSYVYPNSQGVPVKKIAFVLNVPGKNVILISGIYAEIAKVETVSSLKKKSAAIVLCPDGFDDTEYNSLKKSLDRYAIRSIVFSSKSGVVKGMNGTTAKATSITDFRAKDFDAVVFVGGRGLEPYLTNPSIHNIAKNMKKNNKIIAANYWAPVILANAGILAGKKATVTPIEADVLKQKGAKYKDKVIIVDGKLITGNGSATTDLYADVIASKILIDTFR